MNENPDFTKQIEALLAKGDLRSAIAQLKALLENSPLLDKVIQQSGRFERLYEKIHSGTISYEAENVAENQISKSILALLREIETQQLADPHLNKEVERAIAIVNSKNVNTGTANAGRDIHFGDTNNYYAGEHKIPHALTPLPFWPEIFLGRDRELEDIRSLLFSGTNLLLLVNGEGGVGKTSLASRYFHTYQHDYAHIAWVLSEKNITNALLLLAPELGLTFEDRQPATARLEKLLTAMASLNKPCLLVIDNANEPNDLEANYQHLRRCSNFHLLLTTRITTFEQAGTYAIQGLPEEKALELFRRHYTKFQPETEGALFQQLYAAVGGNTLVLELLAKNLALRNQLKTRYALTDLLVDLREKGLLQLSQSQAVRTDYQSRGGGMRHEKPEDIIAAMYELSELSAEEVALLSVFAVLPAESIAFEMLEKLLPNAESLEGELLALAQKGWIEYNEAENAFKCSPVVQEIAKKKNLNLRADCGVVIATLIEKLKYVPGLGHLLNATYEEAAHLGRYAESVLHSLPEPDQNLSILTDCIGNFYQATGNLEQALAYYKAGMEMNEALVKRVPDHAGHKNNLAISYEKLGDVQRALGNLESALAFYEQYNALEKELYESFPDDVLYKNNLAISYEKLGDVQRALGNLESALTFYKQYNVLEKELHKSFPDHVSYKNGLAISYERLGDVQRALGNLESALTFYEKETKLFEELHDSFPDHVSYKNGLAISYSKLGDVQSAMGNLESALTFYEQYNALRKELHESFPDQVSYKNGLAISYSRLGEVQSALGNLESALTFYEQYNALEKELHESFPDHVEFKNGLAISYEKLGDVQSALGNLDSALIFYENETKIFEELYDSYPQNVSFKNGLAISHLKLGVFYRDYKKDIVRARPYIQRCYTLWEQLTCAHPAYVEFQKNFEEAKEALESLD